METAYVIASYEKARFENYNLDILEDYDTLEEAEERFVESYEDRANAAKGYRILEAQGGKFTCPYSGDEIKMPTYN